MMLWLLVVVLPFLSLDSSYAATCSANIDCAYPECGGGSSDVTCYPSRPEYGLPAMCLFFVGDMEVDCPCPSACVQGRQLDGCGCTACAAGSYCINGIATPCTTCTPGVQYRVSPCSSTANTQCAACSTCGLGRLQIAACQSTTDTVCGACTQCPVGTYQSVSCQGTTDSVCSLCATGTFASVVGATKCTLCPANHYCTASASLACPNGTFSLAGSHDVSQCQCPGNATSDGLNCTCNSGFLKVVSNASIFAGWQCIQCGPGTLLTSTRCATCPANYFCPAFGEAVRCPDGTYSTPGATNAGQCSSMAFVAHAMSYGAAVFHDATGNDTLQFRQSGFFTLSQSTLVSLLLVGGGGAGGTGGGVSVGGGGGAGAVIFFPEFILGAGMYNVIIGDSGRASSMGLNLFVASGGGVGGSNSSVAGGTGGSGGGSGGGCYVIPPISSVGSSNVVFGEPFQGPGPNVFEHSGGVCVRPNAKNDSGGGGGGAGRNGSLLLGGDGVCNATLGESIYVFSAFFAEAYTSVAQLYSGSYYIAGGGAGATNNLSTIRGGYGGGGMASNNMSSAGSPNTGGGGGGGSIAGRYGGLGGSGLALIRLAHTMPCAPGSYADGRHTSCMYCDAGTFSSGGDVTGCTSCGIGTVSTASGASNCIECPANFYCCDSATVTPCPNGTYSWPGTTNISHCSCQPNASSIFDGYCACDPGFETVVNPLVLGGKMCKPCDAGTFAKEFGTQNCSTCPVDHFCNQTYQPLPCPVGMHSDFGSTDESQCSCPMHSSFRIDGCTCDPGYQREDASCTPCAAGTFVSVPGTSCEPCAAGSYSAAGASVCTPCPNNSWSVSGGPCVVDTGYYDVGSSMLAYYTFNPSDVLADVTGITGSLTSVGSVAFSADSPFDSLTGWLGGSQNVANLSQPGTLADGDPLMQYLTIPDIAIPSLFSICVWFWPSSEGADSPSIIDFLNELTYDRIMLFRMGQSSDGYIVISSFSPPRTGFLSNVWMIGSWHHVCMTLNATRLQTYIDGVASDGSDLSTPYPGVFYASGSGYIGRSHIARDLFSGYIDEIRVFNRSLTASEIQAVYNFRGDTYNVLLPVSCTNCSGGYYAASPCMGITDSVCTACSNCSRGMYQSRLCTADSDVVCSNCSDCVDGHTYEVFACEVDADTVCAACSSCVDGSTYQISACTAGADAACAACSSCVDGSTYQIAACTSLSDTVCAACTTCSGNNSYTSAACTLMSDTVCSPCSACVAGSTYLSSACTSAVDAECTACSTCEIGVAYESQACTPASDVTCSACSSCVDGSTYRSVACSSSADTVCLACTVCEAGYYASDACTNTSDTVCVACSSSYYCEAGATAPSLCALGFYCPLPSVQLACANESYCVAGSTSQGTCPANHYCSLHQAVLCPNGTYSWPGASNVDQCECPANANSSSGSCKCNNGFEQVVSINSLGGWMCKAIVVVPPAAYVTAVTVGVLETHFTVCSNLSFYVSGFCDALGQANPADVFTCEATAIDTQICPCLECNASSFRRRLLSAYTSVDISSSHNNSAVNPPVLASWMANVTIQNTCPVSGCKLDHEQPDPVLIGFIAFFGVLLLVLCCCGLRRSSSSSRVDAIEFKNVTSSGVSLPKSSVSSLKKYP